VASQESMFGYIFKKFLSAEYLRSGEVEDSAIMTDDPLFWPTMIGNSGKNWAVLER